MFEQVSRQFWCQVWEPKIFASIDDIQRYAKSFRIFLGKFGIHVWPPHKTALMGTGFDPRYPTCATWPLTLSRFLHLISYLEFERLNLSTSQNCNEIQIELHPHMPYKSESTLKEKVLSLCRQDSGTSIVSGTWIRKGFTISLARRTFFVSCIGSLWVCLKFRLFSSPVIWYWEENCCMISGYKRLEKYVHVQTCFFSLGVPRMLCDDLWGWILKSSCPEHGTCQPCKALFGNHPLQHKGILNSDKHLS